MSGSPLASADPVTARSTADDMQPRWEIEVFFDGDCPLCSKEIAMFRRRDHHQRIRFTDIAGEVFQPESIGKTQSELMAEIHGRLSDGTIISGVEVIRRLYAAVGFSRLVGITRMPGLSRLLNVGYRLFARNRLKLTGRRCQDNVCRTA